MKKYKSVLGNISNPDISPTKNSNIDEEIEMLEKKSKANDQEMLIKKNKLLQKQVQLLKQSKKSMEKELQAYRKVVLKNGDIHEILQLQYQQIFDLQTNLQVLQNKYDKLLSSTGSGHQTQYAIKCKQLENILKNKEIEHQKEISALKAKMMRMNASELLDNSRGRVEVQNEIFGKTNGSIQSNANTITPIKNSRKLV